MSREPGGDDAPAGRPPLDAPPLAPSYDGRERRATPSHALVAVPPPVEPALARRHARHLALLRAVSTRLTHTTTPAEAAELLLDTLGTAYGAAWVALYRANPDGSFVRRALRPAQLDGAGTSGAVAAPEHVAGPAVTRLHYAPDAPVQRDASPDDPDPARLLGAEIAVPVDDHGSRLGWLAVGPRRAALDAPPAGYDEADLHFLALVANFAAPRITYADLAAAYRHASLLDRATGLGNRRAFEERIEEELARSNRTAQPMALVLCELDAVAQLTSRYGAEACERMLRAVAEAVSQSVRRSDTVFRHGDTRIAVIISNADASGARIAAERLRAGVAALAPPDVAEPLTCSVGIAALKGVHKPISLATLALYNKAESALHRAAKAGGDRCVAG